MDAKEIMKMISKIAKMDELDEVSIKTDDFSLTIKKTGSVEGGKKDFPLSFQTQQVDTQPKSPFSSGNSFPKSNIASVGQVKFARDLIQKNFSNNEREAMDFLAHTLEVPMSDIPEISTWETTLSRDMVGPMIDALESMWKRNKKGGAY